MSGADAERGAGAPGIVGMPLVSIIIPVYNGENYLCEAIDSALAQTYPSVEVLVVNDGSTDATEQICLSYGDRIRYYHKKNGGVASALNLGINAMRGEYFAWLSHDDLFCRDKISAQMALLTANPAYTISAGNYSFFDGSHRPAYTDFERYYTDEELSNSLFLLLWGDLHFSSLLFHRSIFEQIGLFNEALLTAQDVDFMFRLLRGRRILFAHDRVSCVRVHEEAGSKRNYPLLCRENRKVYYRMLRELKEEVPCIFGDPGKLCFKIGGIIHAMGDGSEEADMEKMMEFVAPSKMIIPEWNERPLYLYGAGEYGRRLNYELGCRQIKPVAFLDRSAEKQGQTVDGLPVLAPETIQGKRDAVAVIALKYYTPAEDYLRTLNISSILLKQDVDALLFHHE